MKKPGSESAPPARPTGRSLMAATGYTSTAGERKGKAIPDTTARVYRGYALYAERGREIEPAHSTGTHGAYRVPGCDGERRYSVVLGPGGGCGCPDQSQHCKHISSAALYRDDGGRHSVVAGYDSQIGRETYRVHDRRLGLDVTGPALSYEAALEYMVEEIDDCREGVA